MFNEIYKQKFGVQVGNHISVMIRVIIMSAFLEEIVNDTDIHIQFLFK